MRDVLAVLLEVVTVLATVAMALYGVPTTVIVVVDLVLVGSDILKLSLDPGAIGAALTTYLLASVVVITSVTGFGLLLVIYALASSCRSAGPKRLRRSLYTHNVEVVFKYASRVVGVDEDGRAHPTAVSPLPSLLDAGPLAGPHLPPV